PAASRRPMPIARAKPRTCLDRRGLRPEVGPLRRPRPRGYAGPVGKVGKPLVKEYSTGEIVVEWEPRLCIHSGNCSQLLPSVFDRDRRPWVMADEAPADEIERVVAQCPSGALRARRLKGVSVVPPQPREICASENGPLLVTGGVRVVDADG